MNRITAAVDTQTIMYDRETGVLTGAGPLDTIVVGALRIGSVLTKPFGHRGYGLGCKIVSVLATNRDIVVKLSSDAAFAVRRADPHWSKTLNRRYDYEEEMEALLRSAAGLKYALVDCGANFGCWSALATGEPFGKQSTLAIEAASANATRLEANARLNDDRFRCLNAAIGEQSIGYARIVGQKGLFFTVTEPSDLDRIKRHAWVGYKIFATSSPQWEDGLLSATWAYR